MTHLVLFLIPSGHHRHSHALLGSIWWTRRLWCCSHGIQSSPTYHSRAALWCGSSSENQNNSPPICLAKNGSPFQAEAKKGACLDGEEQDGLLNEPRFHMEKDISVESLVMGIIEITFREMVRTVKDKISLWMFLWRTRCTNSKLNKNNYQFIQKYKCK